MPRSLSVALSLSITHLLVLRVNYSATSIQPCNAPVLQQFRLLCFNVDKFCFRVSLVLPLDQYCGVALVMVVTQAEQAIFGTLS